MSAPYFFRDGTCPFGTSILEENGNISFAAPSDNHSSKLVAKGNPCPTERANAKRMEKKIADGTTNLKSKTPFVFMFVSTFIGDGEGARFSRRCLVLVGFGVLVVVVGVVIVFVVVVIFVVAAITAITVVVVVSVSSQTPSLSIACSKKRIHKRNEYKRWTRMDYCF